METSGRFFLKTMQFHDFDSIVVDPCCVKDKDNIQNPLPVYRGGLLGNCGDKRSGGKKEIPRFWVVLRMVTTESSVPLGRGRCSTFLVPKAPKTCLYCCLTGRQKVGAGGHFRRPQRGQEDGMTDWQVFGLPLQLQMHFMNLLLHIFLPNFEHYFVNS